MTYLPISPYRIGGGAAPTRLSVSGPYFIDPDGALVIRKSITAFTAPKRYATGRADEARAYLDWWAGKGGNEARVFSRVDWTGPPGKGVEGGWTYDEASCSLLLQDAAGLGLRVELVALTYASAVDEMAAHLERVDRLCQQHENALLEIANEPERNSIDVAEVLKRYVPRSIYATGVYDPTPYPAGRWMTYHSPRKYEWSRCFKDAYEFYRGDGPTQPFQPPYLGPVMLDEPPQVEQTIRDQQQYSAADDWEAYGCGAAFFAAGATMHGNPDFQQCVIPASATVQACCDAFIRGLNTPPLQRYSGYNRLDPPSTDPGSRHYTRTGEDGWLYHITVRPFGFWRG